MVNRVHTARRGHPIGNHTRNPRPERRGKDFIHFGPRLRTYESTHKVRNEGVAGRGGRCGRDGNRVRRHR